ncbi:MAG TPA: hypothetical protein H9881_09155 [Candidatus Stackebrandtia excrementipullorum]|nr:hypothetical protein [Candidatus Stackebrandtia excrementipullorum]
MTRRILRILGSRYGIAAILVLLVVVVVAVAQANSDPRPGGSRQQDGVVKEPSPGAPDDGYAVPDSEAAEEPTTENVLPAQAIADATTFADLWVVVGEVSAEAWYARLAPYATEATAQQLSGVDPLNVPASEIIGEPTIVGPTVEFDTDQGLLILTMTEENGTWKVSSIDFDHRPR